MYLSRAVLYLNVPVQGSHVSGVLLNLPRCATTILSKSQLESTINSQALCGEKLGTRWSRSPQNHQQTKRNGGVACSTVCSVPSELGEPCCRVPAGPSHGLRRDQILKSTSYWG